MTIDILKFKDLIEILPLLLNYIVPGYIFYSIYDFQLGCKNNKEDNFLLKNIVFSFFLNTLLSIFLDQENKYYSLILLALSVVIALAYINIIEQNWYITISNKLNFYKSVKIDLISDIIDSKLGMWVRIYIKGESVIYTGKLIRYDNETENMHRYFVLSEYSCHSYEGEELEDHYGDINQCVLINIANSDRVELIYSESSEKISRLKKAVQKNS